MTLPYELSDSVRNSQIRTLYMSQDRTDSSVSCVYMLLLQYTADTLKYFIPCILILLIAFYFTKQYTMFIHYIHFLYEYFSCMFRRYIHHRQGNIFLPFIQTIY